MASLRRDSSPRAGYEKWGGEGKFITTDKFIETLYNDLKGNKTGEFVKHN